MLVPALLVTIGFGLATSASLRVRVDGATAVFPIVEFELAGDGAEAERILTTTASALPGPSAASRTAVDEAVRRSLWWDFGFIAGYALTIYSLARLVGERFRPGRFGRVGRAVAWFGPAAGVLDLVENWALFGVLAGPAGDGWPRLAAAASWPKWVLAGLAVLYLTAGLLAWAGTGLRGRLQAG